MGIGSSLGSHHVTVLSPTRQLQAINLYHYHTVIQTLTIQPKSYNPRINTCLSNTAGSHEGWDKIMQLKCVN